MGIDDEIGGEGLGGGRGDGEGDVVSVGVGVVGGSDFCDCRASDGSVENVAGWEFLGETVVEVCLELIWEVHVLEGVAIGLVDFAEDREVDADGGDNGGIECFNGVFDVLVEIDGLGGGGGCGGGVGWWVEVVEE